MTRGVYLDNNATTRTDPDVVRVMLPYFAESYGNPSSTHAFGSQAVTALSDARHQVQVLLGAEHEQEIIFTSGATEANSAALVQALRRENRNEVIVSAVEHPAILNVCADMERQHELRVHRVGVDDRGRLDLQAYEQALGPKTALVSLMWANNETGTLFDIPKLARMAHQAGALFHTDAVQAVGKIAIDVKATKIDMLSLSAHKFHGPKGAGALYVRKGVKFQPLLRGGRQERGRRAGTENVPAIVGLGRAAELAGARLRDDAVRIGMLRDWLERSVRALIGDVIVLGDRENRLPGTSAIAFDGADSEEILHRLNKAGIAASAGSACASGAIEPSHVLRAMRVPYTAAHGVVRFSLSRETTEAQINTLLCVLPDVVAASRSTSLFATTGTG